MESDKTGHGRLRGGAGGAPVPPPGWIPAFAGIIRNQHCPCRQRMLLPGDLIGMKLIGCLFDGLAVIVRTHFNQLAHFVEP